MIGRVISHYKILEKLGEGGMGVVYKAHDTKLDRNVALKFLPPHLSASEADKARFIQEAKAASSLNHPNVCTIHDIQEHDGQMFIVMEFVEGQTLRDKKGTVSFKQAIDIGIQVADGLSAAHERGIVHRDIKPENIMIRKDGIAQIMDFGLAKLRGVSRLTKEGSTVGTAGYMSPEQVQGQDADHRSDIFSLGVLLYELITGQLPFKGVHETALMYEIVNVDAPPMSSIKSDLDPHLDAIVLECLEKDANERTQSAKQVSIDLKRFKRESSRQRASRISPARKDLAPSLEPSSSQHETLRLDRRLLIPWMVAAVLFLGLAVLSVVHFRSGSSGPSLIKSSILSPQGVTFHLYGNEAGPVAISPDGKRLAFSARDSSSRKLLYVRSLEDLATHALPGTEGAQYPFWSSDNQFIGFFAFGKLKKISPSGGPALTVCDVPGSRGGSWSRNGMIVFSPGPGGALLAVSAEGGTPASLTQLNTGRKETTHRWPFFLSDGKHFLYFARTVTSGSESERDAIYVGSTDEKINRILVNTSSNPAYASGYLLYVTGQTLMAQRFDEDALELAGDPMPVANDVAYDASITRGMFSVSQTGTLVYQTGKVQVGSQLVYYDRSGKQIGRLGEPEEFFFPRFSPDGQRLAVSIFDQKSRNLDIWIYDLARGLKTRFTFGIEYEFNPVWSPDGSRIAYQSNPKTRNDLFWKSSTGATNQELLYESNEDKFPSDWSPGGKLIAFQFIAGSTTQSDIAVLPVTGDHKPAIFLQTEFSEQGALFSPDGKWIAYMSDESGQNEVYVRPFPGPGGKWQVSVSGGVAPAWRRDGKELYYVDKTNRVMVAEVISKGPSIEVKNVKRLFETPSSDYDITADGRKFLVNVPIETQLNSPLTLVVNWDRELTKK